MTALSLGAGENLKQVLALGLSQHSSIDVAWQLGRQADSPSTAFFIAYQCALRKLDPQLKPHEWAALAVSERGVKSPYDLRTTYSRTTKWLAGEKSYLLWPSLGLDWLYLLAKENEELVALRLTKAQIAQLQRVAQSPAPIMPELPHYALSFALSIPAQQLFSQAAHREINKPFRYFEDVHVALALAAWLVAQQPSFDLERNAQALQTAFLRAPAYYSLESLAALEHLLQAMDQAAQGLTGEAQRAWRRDSQLFKFTAGIRNKIKAQLLNSVA